MNDINVNPDEVKQFVNKNGNNLFSNLSQENREKIQSLQEDIADINDKIETLQPLGDYATNQKVDGVILRVDNIETNIDFIDSSIDTMSEEIVDLITNKAEKNNVVSITDYNTNISRIDNQLDVINQTIIDDKSELQQAIGVVAEDVSNTYNKQEIDLKISEIEQSKGYSKSETDNLLNQKANQASLEITNNNLSSLTGDVENLAGEIDVKADKINTYTKQETNNLLSTKADKSDIPTIPINISYFNNDSGYIDNTYHDITKQDVISDLSTIRVNAQIGAGLSTQVGDNTSNIAYLDEKVREIELFKFPNAVIIGEPNIINGQVSGFSTSNYMQFPFILDLHNQAFQIDFCFTTATNVTTQQNILDSNFGLALAIQNSKGIMAISSNGTSWDIGSSIGSITIQSNTTYYARLIWNRLQYKTQISTDGINYTDDMVIVNTKSPYPRTIFIGGCDNVETGHTPHPFLGSINMNKAFMSVMGNVIWQGMDDAGLSTRADLSLSNLDELGEKRFTDLQDNIDLKANTSDLSTHTSNSTIHVTANDKVAWSQKQNTFDNTLTTTDKTIVGAINELNAKPSGGTTVTFVDWRVD